MKKLLTILIIVITLLTLVITCPSADQHKTAIKDVCTEALQEKSNNIFVSMLGGYVLDALAQQMISSKNFFVASAGYIEYEDESRLTSIGILGHVFVLFDKDDLNDAIADLLNQ